MGEVVQRFGAALFDHKASRWSVPATGEVARAVTAAFELPFRRDRLSVTGALAGLGGTSVYKMC